MENALKYLPDTVYTDKENYEVCYEHEVGIW
jgi:hypothetical protein